MVVTNARAWQDQTLSGIPMQRFGLVGQAKSNTGLQSYGLRAPWVLLNVANVLQQVQGPLPLSPSTILICWARLREEPESRRICC